ncbi:MAG: DUF2834 domain-containing protein [Calothrix sp. C42_A2020_038]|nr:DUF2834 domain-containing protein [Calothrix sp. C42_A2020_038]
MLRKTIFWLIWLGFSTYAFVFAPPNQPDTFELIKNLSIGQWQGINPLVVALFNIMGVLPMIYSCLVFIDGRVQKIPAWPFALGSFGVGAFALLPYIALRESNPHFLGQKNTFIKILDSRVTGILLSVGAIILIVYGIAQGNWSDFVQQWQTSRFIHVMSLDFCLLCLLFATLVGDDMARRGMNNQGLFWWLVTFVPLFGALIYLCLRKPLPEVSSQSNQSQQKPVAT